jgi:hypothetical protein
MLITFGLHFNENVQKNVFLNCLVNFQNCPVIKKKGHYGFKVYPYPNILIHLVNWTTYMLPYRSKKAFIFLKFNTKKKEGGGKLPPSTFQSGEGN